MGSRVHLTVGSVPELFSSIFRGAGACGVAKQFIKNFIFQTWAGAAGFNNNIDLTRR